MQELITLGFGLVIGGFVGFSVGFSVGVRKVVDKAEAAAQDFIDALRDRFGSVVEREVEVDTDEFGDPITEVVEFIELPEDIEELAEPLFNLK